ncbi:ArsR/SmtB family transcription factor [Microlunatus capsulatus]|uniref:DNA-binding transcriptional ArsR family regulator n=1 Tax=Microlunatus capsulatus TaxID=99117 RepID=A0ABS4Z2F3_9ACTN|nr:winged helix-turn-helix domain-containing protein [Microlunatus capsulatus]MBP2415231.1 DNA-binding transcriptional ArsR family regulator [Microlunatus capsulatus]
MTDHDVPTSLRLDAAAVRVLAHPLRSRLLSRLRVDGPATATDLAAVLSTNTGATSYHLRKLESVGLVADTGEGEGRRRLWRASTTAHRFHPSDHRGDDDASAAVAWLQRYYVGQMAGRAEGWFDASDGWPGAWVDAAGYGDTAVTVTAEQLAAVQEELWAVLERWRTAGEGDPAARQVLVSVVAHPRDVTDPPAGQP